VALALAAQTAEHEYVGTRCGIMDQYVCALGQAEHALLIDCRTFDSRPVPLSLGDRRLVVCDTRVRHELASSEYNQRRGDCERGVALLASALGDIRALRDVSEEQLRVHGPLLPELIHRRCRHVVRENARTLAAAEALELRNFEQLGELMTASHRSLRDDYEVSCPELDLAVETALSVSGVLGSRMTGGGFGGCTVSLVEGHAVEKLSAALLQRFSRDLAIDVQVFATRACQGVREDFHTIP
jgi:galactokinase